MTLAPATGAQAETPATEGARTSRVPVRSKRAKRVFNADAQARFCELTAQGMSCAAATRELGFHRGTPYEVASKDEGFQAAWSEARETGADLLEDVAYRLATEGGEDVEYDGDGNVRRRTKRAPSPAIVARVLAAWRPEKWGDRAQVSVGVNVGADGTAEAIDRFIATVHVLADRQAAGVLPSAESERKALPAVGGTGGGEL